MKKSRFVSIGECMIEMSGGEGDQYRLGFAGDTLNTAWYARAGLNESWDVDYLSCVGEDIYSDRMLAFLDGAGIGTQFVTRLTTRRPGLYLIHQADGDRHFTYWRENSAARRLAEDPKRLAAALNGAALIYVSGISLAILDRQGRENLYQGLFDARVLGAKVAFDPNARPALWPSAQAMRDEIVQMCNHVDYAFPTFDDERELFGDADVDACAARYDGYGVPEVIVKNGAENAMVATELDRIVIPAQRVERVIDATGAGDSFAGAYLAQRLAGVEMGDACTKAHAVAARVVQHRGALIPMAEIMSSFKA